MAKSADVTLTSIGAASASWDYQAQPAGNAGALANGDGIGSTVVSVSGHALARGKAPCMRFSDCAITILNRLEKDLETR